MKLLLIWLLNALALLAVVYLVPGIHVDGFAAAMVAALLMGFMNMLVRPVLVLLTLPITVLTMGLFILVINGVLFYAVGYWLEGFEVQTFLAGIIGALLYSIFSWLLSLLLVDNK